MSGICGVHVRDGPAQDLRNALAVLLEDLSCFGAKASQWHDASGVALGHRQEHIYRRDALEHQPVVRGNVILTADARLISPGDVARELGLTGAAHAQIPDSELIARAWQRWGTRALERLEGEFCFAAWDRTEQRLTLVRDPLGLRPLYYARWPGGMAFSTSLSGLIRLPKVDLALDEQAIADYLGSVATEDGSTPYRGVRRLPPGSIASWAQGSGSAPRRYWHIATAAHVRLATAGDYVEAVRERVQKVIAQCCDTEHGVGMVLSGGLDSSTLLALTAGQLAGQGRHLVTASSVLPVGHQGAARDERLYIEAVCARYPNVSPLWITAEDRQMLTGVDEDLARHAQPRWNPFAVMDDALHEALRDAHARVVLDGLHGDSVWSFEHPVFPLDFLLRGHPAHAWREWAALSGRYQVGRLTLARRVLAGFAGRFPTWRGSARARLMAQTGPTCVSLALARRSRLARRVRHARSGGAPRLTLRAAQRADLASAVWPRLREELACSAAGRGQSHRSPLWDRQVVTLCLSAPPQALHRAGFGRQLARTIAAGLIPELVRTRSDKGAFLPDFHNRVLRERAAIGAAVEHDATAEYVRQFIDVELIQSALTRLEGELPLHHWALEAQTVIVRGQAMARFLKGIERCRQDSTRKHEPKACPPVTG